MDCGYFDTTWNDNHCSFLTPTVVGGRRPLPPEICAQSDPPPFQTCQFRQISAYNISTVRDSDRTSIMMTRKSTTGFPTSYRWRKFVNMIFDKLLWGISPNLQSAGTHANKYELTGFWSQRIKGQYHNHTTYSEERWRRRHLSFRFYLFQLPCHLWPLVWHPPVQNLWVTGSIKYCLQRWVTGSVKYCLQRWVTGTIKYWLQHSQPFQL